MEPPPSIAQFEDGLSRGKARCGGGGDPDEAEVDGVMWKQELATASAGNVDTIACHGIGGRAAWMH